LPNLPVAKEITRNPYQGHKRSQEQAGTGGAENSSIQLENMGRERDTEWVMSAQHDGVTLKSLGACLET
jgi:hypothetical protein